MSDLFENQIQGINEPEFSVSEISNAIKRLIEEEFSYVRIRGEIGRVSLPRSGHVYLDLKDEKCVRLSKGKDNSSIVYNEDPEKQAIYFEQIGCKKLHLIDLDAAFGRSDINFETIKNIKIGRAHV